MSYASPNGADEFKEKIMIGATQAVTKFNENFFMRKHMEKYNNQEESKNTEESKNQMDQSFYRKQGLDFLSFQRPGTAYGSTAFQNAAVGTTTKSGFFDAKTKEVKPFEMMEQRKAKSVLSQLWFTRAEKILTQVEYLMNVLEFVEYASVATNRVTYEYMVTLQTD